MFTCVQYSLYLKIVSCTLPLCILRTKSLPFKRPHRPSFRSLILMTQQNDKTILETTSRSLGLEDLFQQHLRERDLHLESLSNNLPSPLNWVTLNLRLRIFKEYAKKNFDIENYQLTQMKHLKSWKIQTTKIPMPPYFL